MDIGIIGGGASGMLLASKLNKHKITILEKNSKLGKKLLLTGNGKCNFTNMNFDNLDYIYNCNLAKSLYSRYNNISFINYLKELGVVAKTETHKNIDYVYPNSNKATSVYYSLYDKIVNNNVNIIYNSNVISIKKNNNKFEIKTETGKSYLFDKLVFAFGGATYKKTGTDGKLFTIAKELGHTVNEALPGLTPLKYKVDNININKINFTGFRVDAKVSTFDESERVVKEYGEIQFTKEYISGIPILNLSSKIARKLNEQKELNIYLDFSDALINNILNDKDNHLTDSDNYKEKILLVKESLIERKNLIFYKKTEDFLCGYLPDELNAIISELLKIKNKKVSELTDSDLDNIAKIISNFKITIVKNNSYDNAQITIGGISTNEVDLDTLESKIIKGLYIIGESLDIDGICGGYNLQMCFSSASAVADNFIKMEE